MVLLFSVNLSLVGLENLLLFLVILTDFIDCISLCTSFFLSVPVILLQNLDLGVKTPKMDHSMKNRADA